jgi:bifunctional N6-L-threonylcarbamoyladenine synthase / protein kinase Bud32
MVSQKIIQQGAEAVIYKLENKVIKDRVPKSYRLEELDTKIRTRRTKAETKIINKLKGIIPVPKILEDKKQKNKKSNIIHMQFISGKKLSEHLESLDYKEIAKQIGQNITKIHEQDIIHGDLTTSNMIYVKDNLNPISQKKYQATQNDPHLDSQKDHIDINTSFKIYFIDFGLGFHSKKVEDKAVDLHLLKQALDARHFKVSEEMFKIILDNYSSNNSDLIKKRIKVIKSRGRYKDKY